MNRRSTLSGLILSAGVLAAMTVTATAGSYRESSVSNCIFSGGAVNCVRHFRSNEGPGSNTYALRPPSDDELAEARARDRKWQARCKPLLRPDRYGVSRYYYAAPGCEYGQTED